MSVSTVDAILGKYPLISDQVNKDQVKVILVELQRVLDTDIPGDIVEFGCYIGTTSLFIRRLLDSYCHPELVSGPPKGVVPASKILKQVQNDKMINRIFHAYDSFEGLPEKTAADGSRAGEQFRGGELAISKKAFLREFQKAHLVAPITHKGWFKDLAAEAVPEKIAFAFLDGDFYESIRDSLHLVLPRMQKGGTIVIDDYAREALPGAARAVHEHFRPDQVRTAHNLGIIHL